MAYDSPAKSDGLRVLVDRLWPRGRSKDKAKVDIWAKELAPSHELRKWFHSEEGTFAEFKKRYRRELRTNKQEARALRKQIGRRKDATKDSVHNHAQLLGAFLEELS